MFYVLIFTRMELQTEIKVLQQELKIIAKLRKEEAQHRLVAMDLFNKILLDMIKAPKSASVLIIPENDYATLVEVLTTNPGLKKTKSKYVTESWPAYAARLSKFVKWRVDADVLKVAFAIHDGAEK